MSQPSINRALVFDISARFAHFKRIYATTTALTYPLPMKTAVYGLLGAILGLEREDNAYLKSFAAGSCSIGLRLTKPLKTQRLSINLRPDFGALYAGTTKANRKPTLMEFLYEPGYRLYVHHTDELLYEQLKAQLVNGRSAYTPSLGLANLIAKIDYQGEAAVNALTTGEVVPVSGVVPKSRLTHLDPNPQSGLRLQEVAQYAVEMTPDRDVTVRDALLLDRNGGPIRAAVTDLYELQYTNQRERVILF